MKWSKNTKTVMMFPGAKGATGQNEHLYWKTSENMKKKKKWSGSPGRVTTAAEIKEGTISIRAQRKARRKPKWKLEVTWWMLKKKKSEVKSGWGILGSTLHLLRWWEDDDSVSLEPGDVHTTLSSTHSEGSGGSFVFIQTKKTRPFRRTELSLLIFHGLKSHYFFSLWVY